MHIFCSKALTDALEIKKLYYRRYPARYRLMIYLQQDEIQETLLEYKACDGKSSAIGFRPHSKTT